MVGGAWRVVGVAWWVVNQGPRTVGRELGVHQDGARGATVRRGAAMRRDAAVRTTKRARAMQSDCESAVSSLYLTSLDSSSVLSDMSSRGKKKTRARSTA